MPYRRWKYTELTPELAKRILDRRLAGQAIHLISNDTRVSVGKIRDYLKSMGLVGKPRGRGGKNAV